MWNLEWIQNEASEKCGFIFIESEGIIFNVSFNVMILTHNLHIDNSSWGGRSGN